MGGRLSEIRIGILFTGDGGGGTVAGENPGVWRKSQKLGFDGVEESGAIGSGEIVTADAIGKEGIADDGGLLVRQVKGYSAGTVPGCVTEVDGVVMKRKLLAVGQELIRRGSGNRQPGPLGKVESRIGKKIFFFRVDKNLKFGPVFTKIVQTGDVIEVGVGENNVLRLQTVLENKVDHGLRLVACVDDPAIARGRGRNSVVRQSGSDIFRGGRRGS